MKREIKAWDYVSIFAVVALAAVFVIDRVVPNPSLTDNARRQGIEKGKLESDLKNSTQKLDNLQKMATNRLWHGSPEQVSPLILQEINHACNANNVTMSRFRPQRGEESGDMVLLSYSFNAEGRFPQVMQTIRALESSKYRIAVTQTNLNSATEDSDTVGAAITVAVYVDKLEEKKKTNG